MSTRYARSASNARGKEGSRVKKHKKGPRGTVTDSFEFTCGEGMGGLAAFNPDVLLARFQPGDKVRVTIKLLRPIFGEGRKVADE